MHGAARADAAGRIASRARASMPTATSCCWPIRIAGRGIARSSPKGRRSSGTAFGAISPGPYQIQAAINAVHSDAPTAAATDWTQILQLYDQLMRLSPAPSWRSTGRSPSRRLTDLRRRCRPSTRSTSIVIISIGIICFTQCVRILLRRLGRNAEATVAYDAAVACAANKAEREFLQRSQHSVRSDQTMTGA